MLVWGSWNCLGIVHHRGNESYVKARLLQFDFFIFKQLFQNKTCIRSETGYLYLHLCWSCDIELSRTMFNDASKSERFRWEMSV